MQKSVLVVVNDIEQARLYRKYLTDRCLNVTCVLDPQNALKNFKLYFESYNMVLTDFTPTDINGITFAKEIRKIRGNSIFIILMTGYFMSHSLRQSEMVDTIIA
jgi:DNA-binding NtrC family response regulator